MMPLHACFAHTLTLTQTLRTTAVRCIKRFSITVPRQFSHHGFCTHICASNASGSPVVSSRFPFKGQAPLFCFCFLIKPDSVNQTAIVSAVKVRSSALFSYYTYGRRKRPVIQVSFTPSLLDFIARLHCSTSLLDFIARLHCSTSLLDFIARLHCSTSLCRQDLFCDQRQIFLR